MNHRTYLNRVTMLAFVLWIGLVGSPALGQRARQKQVALNQQLIAALKKGDNKRALALVHAGADPNTRADRFTPTALALACGAYDLYKHCPEDTRLLQAMLDHGANVNASEDYSGCVVVAILGWRPGMSLATEQSSRLKIGDKTGCTPLKWAVQCNRLKTASLLLDHGANVNLQDLNGYTPLIDAVPVDHLASLAMVRLLLEHGANVNVQDEQGNSVLYFAVLEAIVSAAKTKETDNDIIRLLLEHGADPNIADKQYGYTLLTTAGNRPDIVALLKQYGARK
jgi:uncharacterized protein